MATTSSTTHRLLQTDHADTMALPRGATTRLPARAGHTYRVVLGQPGTAGDAQSALADDVIATRRGKALHLSYPDKTEAVFDDFFEACADDRCTVELPADDKAAAYRLSGGSPQGVAAGETGQVLYAHGEQATVTSLMQGQGVAYDGGPLAGLDTAAGHSTYVPPVDRGIAWPWIAGMGIVGGGLAAASGGSGGGNGPAADGQNNGNGNTDADGKHDAPPMVTSTIVGQVTGPVIAGHGLKATAYGADGTALASTDVAADGSFTMAIAPSSYTGAVLVRVVDTSAGPDVRDVATNTDLDLDADLRAVTVITEPGTHHVNVNALTELAVRDLGLAGGNDGASATTLGAIDAAAVQAANRQVAHAVGLGQDLVSGDAPAAIAMADGSPNAGANDYGRLLAAMSGAGSGSSTDAVLASLTGSAGPDGLTPAAIAVLVGGAYQVTGSAQTLVDQISDLSHTPVGGLNTITIDDVAVDNIVNAVEAGAGVAVTGTADSNASIDVIWDGRTETVTADANGVWTANFGPSSSNPIPADGAWTIVATTGGSSAARGVIVDTVGPAAPAAPVDYRDDVGNDTGLHMTSVVTDDPTPGINVGTNLPNTPVLYVDGIKVAAVYDPITGTLTPNTALADGQHAFTYANTDAAGNEGMQSGPLYVVTVADALALSPMATIVTGDGTNAPLTSPSSPSILVGGDGDDVLRSDHVSALYGGNGNDVFEIGQNLIDALDVDATTGGVAPGDDLARIHGNGGTDTIRLAGDGLILHLPSILETGPAFGANHSDVSANRITSIEIVDLTNQGGATNTLLLASADLRLITNDEGGGQHTLRVTSASGGTVDICDDTNTNGWTQGTNVTETAPAGGGSITYQVWNHDTSNTHLLVQTGITVV
ncbi:MAG: Ig-like domain-containing protein [Burkholderiaceae bacterium]